jgi:hypothetical protein
MIDPKQFSAIAESARSAWQSLNAFINATPDGKGTELSDYWWSEFEDRLGALRRVMSGSGCFERGRLSGFAPKERKAYAALQTLVRDVPENPWADCLPGHHKVAAEIARYVTIASRLGGVVKALEAFLPPVDAKGPPNDNPRLTFDRDTLTVTLDGEPYTLEDPTAFQLYKVIVEAEQPPITGDTIRSKVRGLNGSKAVTKRLDSLPDALRQTIKGAPGRGYWLQLPPMKEVRK